VKKVMNGVIGIEYAPSYNYRNTDVGRDFIRRWREQPSTLADSSSGGGCLGDMDDQGAFPLYRSASNASLCNGLDFGAYDVHGDSLRHSLA